MSPPVCYGDSFTFSYCRVYDVYMVITNNSTWIRIGYRICSLWRFITTHRLQLLATDTITHN
jgi:hypothetical protein